MNKLKVEEVRDHFNIKLSNGNVFSIKESFEELEIMSRDGKKISVRPQYSNVILVRCEKQK